MAGVASVLQFNGIKVDQLFESFDEEENCKTFEMDLKIPGMGDQPWPVKFTAERIVECGCNFTKTKDFELVLTPELQKKWDSLNEETITPSASEEPSETSDSEL